MRAAAASLALLVALGAHAGEEDSPNWLELRSALKGTMLMARARTVTLLTPEQVSATSLWRVRLEPRAFPTSWLTVYAAYEQRVRVASSTAALTAPGLPPADERAPFRLVPLGGSISRGPTYDYWQELDRLALAFHLPRVELTVGRQAVGWGRGVLFGAVDLFAPFTPLEVDREWRRGVDAIRADVQLGAKSSAELLAVGAETVEGAAFAGRLRGYLGPVDAEVVGGYRARDWFAGVAASASVLEAELHGELAAFWLPAAWAQGGTFGNDQLILKAVLGASYQFNVGEGLRLVLEYHYNGFGVRFPVSVLQLGLDEDFRVRLNRGDFQTLGRNMIAASVSYPFGMTFAAALQVMVDPADGSGVVAPTLNWDLADNVSLVAGGYVGWGQTPTGLTLNSQLGATPLTVLVQLRVYDQRALPKTTAEPVP